ncbi:structural protein [Flavobacterium sp. AG291]|uniref:structural protein n=1 Tax=Flavobacterium sp. AG291 TaxID=2184000 RepID=UPI000E0C304A|nr:structural protein [Flavobacterium sp. AG291]RDI07041.1 hypothetical protein DEU42_113141 [Flavobacterium sp. AG291]
MAKNYLNKPGYPRGIRNNNPGNLIQTSISWVGKVPLSQNTDGKFEQFIELRYGLRAMMRDLISDIKGGKNTIQALITEYAPSFENNTVSYINTVAASVGITALDLIELSQETIIAICKIMVRIENGPTVNQYITDSDYTEAMAIIGLDLKKKVTLPEQL